MFVGYDPGGDRKHGVAVLTVENGVPVSVRTALLRSAEEVIRWVGELGGPISGIGIDTLTCWSSGPSGWRPADRWLRHHYPAVLKSIASSNSLYGAMSVNGMGVLIALRQAMPLLAITETHPKVMHWHLRHTVYDYDSSKLSMDEMLASEIGFPVSITTDHEWDAAISALVAFRGQSGQWSLDLHTLQTAAGERIIEPCGKTNYYWPE